MSKASLIVGNSNWAIKDSSLLGYNINDSNIYSPFPFDVTRASAATTVNKAGLIVTDAEILSGELVANGNFSNGLTDWNISTSALGYVSTSSQTLQYLVGHGDYAEVKQLNNSVIGKKYKGSFKVISKGTNANVLIQYGRSSIYSGSINDLSIGTHTFTVDSVNTDGFSISVRTNGIIEIDDVSVVEINQNNLARIDYLDSTKGVLLTEPQSTNLITYSESFSSLNIRNNAVVTSNAIISPSGLLDADEITFDGTTDGRVEASIAVTIGQPYTISLYLKNKDLSDVTQVWIGFSAASQGQFVTITNEWQRYDITTNADGTTEYPRIQFSGAGSLYAWGFQTEQQPYATSIIPTNGSTVTRNQDLVINGGELSTFNSEEGVLYCETLADVHSGQITLSNGSNTDNLQISFNLSSGRVDCNMKVGNAYQFIFNYVTDMTINNKIAIKYKANDFALWVNGTEVLTDTSGITPAVNTFTELNFSSSNQASNFFYGKTKQLQVFKKALTDSELQILTTI